MIDPKELQIGNWLLATGSLTAGYWHRVSGIEQNMIFLGQVALSPGNLSGILLTREILGKCGFEQYEVVNSDGDEDTCWRHSIYYRFRRVGKYFEYNYEELSHIQYLHQLQNLFYCLTGQELEVKL